MLWYKGWLETKFKLLFTLGFACIILLLQYSVRNATTAPGHKSPLFATVLFSNPVLVMMICALLAGAGIVTQPSFQATKGLHGSTLFTVSLPVSRLRLLAVRASIGWLEGVVVIAMLCCGMWLVSPPLRAVATSVEMFQYGATLIACGSMLYFLSVLLATFLDDQWRVWCTMIVSAVLWWLSSHISHIPIPAFADIFRAMGKGSPLIAHTVPWTAMAFSLGVAAMLFFAALKIAQTREY